MRVNAGLSSRVVMVMERLSRAAALLGALVGFLVLVAWNVPIGAIITAGSGQTGMARSPAVALVLIGVSLLSLDKAHAAWTGRAGVACALLAIVIGISTLLHLALGRPSYLVLKEAKAEYAKRQ
jgi:hypothetical protein